MRSILKENDDFQRFSRYCEEKANIEKELKNTKIHKKKRTNIEKRLVYLKKEIPELSKMLQREIKVS
jgi:hypothetical protein